MYYLKLNFSGKSVKKLSSCHLEDQGPGLDVQSPTIITPLHNY